MPSPASPDWAALHDSVRRCWAVYLPAERAAAEIVALGWQLLGRREDVDHQAIVSRRGDVAVLTIAGTRLDSGTRIEAACDLMDDADFCPVPPDARGTGRVARGAWAGMAELLGWAFGLAGECGLHVEGHSLGGQRACLAANWLAVRSITAWEPPKAADLEFWGALHTPTAVIVTGRDPLFAWPWEACGLEHPPGPLLWLRDGSWSWVTEAAWPGADLFALEDHMLDRIVPLVAAEAARAALVRA